MATGFHPHVDTDGGNAARLGRVRRARLFYLRGRQGKAARIKELKTTK